MTAPYYQPQQPDYPGQTYYPAMPAAPSELSGGSAIGIGGGLTLVLVALIKAMQLWGRKRERAMDTEVDLAEGDARRRAAMSVSETISTTIAALVHLRSEAADLRDRLTRTNERFLVCEEKIVEMQRELIHLRAELVLEKDRHRDNQKLVLQLSVRVIVLETALKAAGYPVPPDSPVEGTA